MKNFVLIAITVLIGLFFIVGCPQKLPPSAEPPIIDIQTPQTPPAAEITPQPVTPEPQQVETAPKADPEIPEPLWADHFHDKCRHILRTFVQENGSVNYRRLKVGRTQLNYVLKQFAALSPGEYDQWQKEDKIAIWINVYNLQMLKIITDNYPIQSTRIRRLFWPPTSIRHIEGIWESYKFIVMDEAFTLQEIEQRIFRDRFDEPRVFFALTLASQSGPKILNRPYYGKNLDQQFDEQVKDFLARDDTFRIDRKEKKLYLSSIFQPDWYGKDFVSKYATDKKFKDKPAEVRAVLNFITNYLSEPDVDFLETENYTIEYIRYDWRLNE